MGGAAGKTWICLALLGYLQAQVITRQDSLPFSASHLTDTLSYGPVIQASWRIYDRQGEPLDTALINLNPLSREVRWQGPAADAHWVQVAYDVIFGLETTVFGPAWRYLPTLLEVRSDSALIPAVQLPVSGEPGRKEQIVTAGTLYRGVSVTTGRGMNLSGGLNLQLQGELGPGIFLNGHLTDQNLPILPEGDTRSLSELDQVRLSINSRWGAVEVGDFVLRGGAGRLGGFERKLEGMKLGLHRGSWSMEGALAGTKGRYRSQSIQGEDGRQGPYALASHEGSHSLIVLPGTEIVWLNGQRLERGEGRGYTIDYNLGEITFTPQQTIRSDSRIVIDFEYSDLVYNRTTSYLSSAWQGRQSELTVAALTERDNLHSNLEFSLNAADREYLRGIGDRFEEARVSTATADTAGSYDLVDGHYVWQGDGAGDYEVRFFNAGSEGAYRRVVAAGRFIYQWAPPEERSRYQATYAPYRLLKLPQSRAVVNAAWQWKGRNEGRQAQVEVGVSQSDQNRFSPLDDGDNLGAGYAFGLQWRTRPFRLGQRVFSAGIKADGLLRGRRFAPPGRFDAIEFLRDWDLDADPAGYRWETVALNFSEGQEHNAFAEMGQLTADPTQTRRLRWGFSRRSPTALAVNLKQTILDRGDGRHWRITDGEVSYALHRITPFARYYTEDRRKAPGNGFQVRQAALGARAEVGERTSIGLSREHRRDVFTAGDSESAKLWRLTLARTTARRSRLELGLSLNEKTTSGDHEDLSYMMGDLSWVRRSTGSPWWLDLRYRLERRVAEAKAVIYTPAPPGLGQYRYDEVYDTYVPDETGTFLRLVAPAGNLRPVSRVNGRLRTQVDLNRFRKPIGKLGNYAEARVSLQARFSAETARHSLDTYRVPTLEDSTISDYMALVQLDLALQADRNRPLHKVRLSRSVRLNRAAVVSANQGALVGESLSHTTLDLGRAQRFSLAGEQANYEIHVVYETRENRSLSNSLRNHSIRKIIGHGTLSRPLWEQVTANLTARWQQEVDAALAGLAVETRSFGAGVQRAIGTRGRLRLDTEWLNVAASRDVPIPIVMAEGFPAGFSRRIRMSGQVHLSKNLLLSLSLYSRKEAGRTPFTTSTMEIRSQF